MEKTPLEKTIEKRESLGFLPFDPIVVVLDVAKRWLLILLAIVVVGVGSYIVKDMVYTPKYQSSTTYVVTSRNSSAPVFSSISSANSLATVFTDLLNSSLLREAILEEIGATSFDGTIEASVIPETNLLLVKVTASDPQTSFLVSKAIMEHHEIITYEVVDGIVLEVLQNPTVPTAPSNPANLTGTLKKMALLAAVGTIALLAFLSYHRDTVRSGKEAKELLDCDYLGEIPHENKYRTLASRIQRRKSGILITNAATSFSYVETIRKLRRRVEQRMHGKKVLMIASLLENEGKSTVAVNLALALAQKHKRVLLIDCDLRKPACHMLLEQHSITYGLRDVLSGGATVSEVMLQDKRSNLYMLLENRGDKNSGNMISGAKMRELLQWARAEFDYVVLDLPPMAEVSDAEGMAEMADASLLVVRQNTAAVPALNKAISSLENSNSKLLGCVLNNVHSTSLSSGQGYGHGHGYGYGKYSHYGHYGKYGRYGHYGNSSDGSEK